MTEGGKTQEPVDQEETREPIDEPEDAVDYHQLQLDADERMPEEAGYGHGV